MNLEQRGLWAAEAFRSARRPSLLARFGVVALVVMAGLGLALGLQLRSVISDRALDNAERSSLVYLHLVRETFLAPGVAWDPSSGPGVANPAQQSLSEEILGDPEISSEVLSATAWLADGTVAFSTERASIGTVETLPASAVEALAGRPVSVIAGPERVRSDGYVPAEHPGASVLVVDAPFSTTGDDSPELVIEIVTEYTDTAAAVRTDTAVVFGWLGAGLLVLYVALFRLVATASRRLRVQSETNRELAEHDALTGLANRTLLEHRARLALDEARRGGHPLALLLLDLDRFKEINDTLGHHHGDLLLRLVGPRLRSVLGEGDVVARLGGDEFVVLLHQVADVDAARLVGERLLAALDSPFPVDGLDLDVGASLGIAVSPEHGVDVATLLQHADVAMYAAKAKQSGIAVYDPRHDLNSTARLSLLGELRRGIESGQLVLHYQPQAEAGSGAVHGVEALVRWQHPVHGLLAPDEFIPLAESTGLIRPLTLAVLDSALALAARRRTVDEAFTVAVNISAHSLLDPDLTRDVEAALARHGLPGQALVLEITESSIMSDRERARTALVRLADLGVSLSVDDFGTGYSSLAYLHRLPVHELKIDRSFVIGMSSSSNAAIVTASIDMGHALGLRVVAEGVEEQVAWDLLEGFGCDAVQGYHLCRPVAEEALDDWLAERQVDAV
ncbi:putative bifunctional diguanylate cyclase/phosphodiesterase [Actinotalea sp.]|uniref:putative bifunctional diguanylate cyclase/phosphodiesterase n=1 Tax=Actinotalea sp. TaxID=1872145 RepID=UPI003567394E